MEETLREIKQLFFTYRNGALADTLKGAGHPCAVVFGLMIPQIADIARQQTPSLELAQRLWDDTGVRESRILATYLFPPQEVTREHALRLASEVRNAEEADMLAFRLLKRLPCAPQLLAEIEALDTPMAPYLHRSLTRHLS